LTVLRAIVLDFDGVLAESNEVKEHAFEDLFALYPLYQEDMRNYHREHYSMPREEKFKYYVSNFMGRKNDLAMTSTMSKQFSDFVKPLVISAPDVPGAREFLNEFSTKIPLYISSVTPQSELLEIVAARGIAPMVQGIFGNPPWRKPDAICEILKRENADPSEVVFIGDSPSDFYSAKEVGVRFIGRDSGVLFDGIEVKLHKNLFIISSIVRELVKGRDD